MTGPAEAIRDPYAVAGTYRKAQLHCHTTRSDGRFAPGDLARRYRDAGYSFVCFTDHNVVTRADEIADAEFLVVPGVEETVTRVVRPLGPHLGRVMVDAVLGTGSVQDRITRTLDAGGVPVLHHPSWTGNLLTGAWSTATITGLRGPFLVEIQNPHSRSTEDVRRWLEAVRTHGPDIPIGGVAGDDCHVPQQFDRAWVVVKVPEISVGALRTALLSGAFYASTGVSAEFGVDDGAITARTDADEVMVLDAAGRCRATVAGGTARYVPAGDEGFVRLEGRAGARRAWSQPFWIGPGRHAAAEGQA